MLERGKNSRKANTKKNGERRKKKEKKDQERRKRVIKGSVKKG